jgi:diguanylate cyclase (GGDEF)-like protein/PAS domain S-box-containing protein
MSHTEVAGQQVGQQTWETGVHSEQRHTMRTVLDHLSDGLFIVEAQRTHLTSTNGNLTKGEGIQFHFVALNSTCQQMLSVSPKALQGVPVQECLPTNIAQITIKQLLNCFEQQRILEYETTWESIRSVKTKATNQSQILQTRLYPILTKDSKVTQIFGLCKNLNRRQSGEFQLQLLHQITIAITTADDLPAALEIALQACCEATGWNYGEAWIKSTDGVFLEYCGAGYLSTPALAHFQEISQSLKFPKGMGIPGRVWETKKPEWYQDVSQQPEQIFLRAKLAMEWGLKAGVGIPILAGDQLIAVLAFFMFESRNGEDQQLIEMVSTVATQLGALIQRKQAEAALQESQRRLTHLINSLPGIVFACANDAEWSMTYLSQGVFNITGYKSEELTGMNRTITYNEITHPEDLSNVLTAINVAITHQKPYVVEYRIRTKAGEEKWLWEKGSGVYDHEGKILALEGFISDITDRKQAEESLSAQAQVLERMAEGVFVAEEDGTISFTNPALDAMFGYQRGELIGQSILKLSATKKAHTRKQLAKILRQVKTQGSWVGECQNRKKDHTVFTSSLHVSVLEVLGKKSWICVQEDITERKRAEAALKQAEEKYRSIFENAVEGIFQTTLEGRYMTANPMLARIYGYNSPADLMNTIQDIENQLYVHPKRRREFRRILQEHDAVWEFESQVYRKDGSIIWICENARALRDKTGQLIGYEGTVVDISRRKQAEADLLKRDNLLQGVAEAMNHLLTETNHAKAVEEALSTLGKASGVDRVYICENHPHPQTGLLASSLRFEWTAEKISPSIESPFWQNVPYSGGLEHWYHLLSTGQPVCIHQHKALPQERERLEPDGILSILLVPIFTNGEFWGYIGFDECTQERDWSKSEESILVAISASIGGALQRHHQEELIRHQALHDRLTNLPNRQLLDLQLPCALEQAKAQGHKFALMFLDLDRFKIINDTLGHAVGDQLLQGAAGRLRSCLREGDTVVRWGGDEFIVLLPHLNCVDDALHIAGRILEVLRPPFEIETHQLHISISIGIAVYPEDGDDAETLIKNADTALYRVKEQGRNSYQLYTPGMNSSASELLILDNNLYLALERGEFQIYYQPQWNIQTGQIICMEALLRWQHPERGLISPATFIPIAEENGLIVQLGTWALEMACRQSKAWQEAGLGKVRVAVNLSARQFQQAGLVEMVAEILEKTQLTADCLELEITETTAMQNVELTRTILLELQAMGVGISMDDFGIGHASLSGLKNLPFDTLKIDRMFVQDITKNSPDAAIVQAIITLALALNLSVVAEGVETEEQCNLLQSFGCQIMQGYLLSPPLEAMNATTLLHQCSISPICVKR